jgi:hypothetical protein
MSWQRRHLLVGMGLDEGRELIPKAHFAERRVGRRGWMRVLMERRKGGYFGCESSSLSSLLADWMPRG